MLENYSNSIIIGKSECPFYMRACQLAKNNNVQCDKILLSQVAPEDYSHLKGLQKTSPYIFLNGKFVGGCSDFENYLKLNKKG